MYDRWHFISPLFRFYFSLDIHYKSIISSAACMTKETATEQKGKLKKQADFKKMRINKIDSKLFTAISRSCQHMVDISEQDRNRSVKSESMETDFLKTTRASLLKVYASSDSNKLNLKVRDRQLIFKHRSK